MQGVAKPIAAGGAAKPLTVLQLAPARGYGGLERATADMSTALAEAGGRSLIAAPQTPATLRLRATGAEFVEMEFDSWSPLRIRANARTLAEIAAREGVDVIHARTRAAAMAGQRAAELAGARFVTTWSRLYDDGFFDGRLTRSLASGRPVIAVSDYIARRLAEEQGLGTDRVVVIPGGVDMNAFAAEAVSAERTIRLAEAWALAEDSRPVVLAPGRLADGDGLRVLARAAAQLRARRGDDFICLIVARGDPRDVAALEALIVREGAAGVARIVPPTSDMAAALKLSAIVVSPATRPKGSARTIVEAMAMGRPVIASAHGAPAELVRDGVTGWHTAPGDAEALAAAVDQALDLDESGRAHAGLAGRAEVRSRFTLEAAQRATLAVYETAAGRAFAA